MNSLFRPSVFTRIPAREASVTHDLSLIFTCKERMLTCSSERTILQGRNPDLVSLIYDCRAGIWGEPGGKWTGGVEKRRETGRGTGIPQVEKSGRYGEKFYNVA